MLMVKLAATAPKDPDAWGIHSAVTRAVKAFMLTGHKDAVPVVGVLRIKKVETESDDDMPPVHTGVMEIPRLEAVTDPELQRVARAVIERSAVARRGVGATLPFEESNLLDDAFGIRFDIDDARDLQDRFERWVDGGLTDNDRLRRHMVAVHKEDQETVFDAAVDWVRVEHARLHDQISGQSAGGHDRDWLGWTRLQLEAAESWDDHEPAPQPAAGGEDGDDGVPVAEDDADVS